MSTWIAIGALAIIAVLIPLGMMAVSALLRPSVPEIGKSKTYESGEVPTGTTQIRFNTQYYMVALLFLVFDLETIFIFPWVLIYNDAVAQVGLLHALGPMLIFIGVLVAALIWAWRTGAVEWIKSPKASKRSRLQ